MLSFTMKQTNVEAKLVMRAPGHCLVADFRDSMPPVVWQLDLTKGQNIAVALRGRDDDWSLGLVEPKGEFSTVARFDNREDAETAYTSVQKALMKGRACRSHFWRWVLLIIVVLVVILLATKAAPFLIHSASQGLPEATRSSASQLGVPLPADEVLQNQQP